MGWFDEQIKQRIKNDNEQFSAAFESMHDMVLGRKRLAAADAEQARSAVEAICAYYHVKAQELPSGVESFDEQLEAILRPTGIMRRTVRLTGTWYRDGIGALIAKTTAGAFVALLPHGLGGYAFVHPETGKKTRVGSKNAKMFAEDAICFYKPFPLKKLGVKDLLVYCLRSFAVSDYVMIALATLVVTLVGMLMPALNNLLFGDVIAGGDATILLPLAFVFVGITVSSAMLAVVKSLVTNRLSTKASLNVQAATMMRVLSLPADFFKNYGAGELAARAQYMNGLCSSLVSVIFTTGFTSIFSLVYIGQIFAYAPGLVVPALLIILVTVAFSLISTFVQMKLSEKQMRLSSAESGLEFSLVSGVQKIKLAGAEKRLFGKWAKAYVPTADLRYNPPFIIQYNAAFSTAISLIGMIAMYFFAVTTGVGVADYMAFNVSYGMVSGAFMSMASMVVTVANIRPILKMIQPIMQVLPEVSEGKRVINRLSGGIEINNVTFRYDENMPAVLDNLSIKIRAGQYIAIVGKTGCGKSTLMRLLLGFERPQKGAIYYDGQDLDKLDLKSLRRNLVGVVMQDGKLFQGDIYSNIVISAPWLTLDDAWKAAEMAGVADDIRNMPMEMHTMISEGSGGVSGGQRQRLMIARAIASKPKILMLDEATSALDNVTQKKVSDSLASLKCTRIVIAHRLSTIKQCDRIIVLDGGKIVEDGKYDELIARGGFFADLVERQRLDS